MSVRREKYDKVKNHSRSLQRVLDEVAVENAEKSLEIVNQEKDVSILKEEVKKLQSDVNRWKSLSERLPDESEIEELKKNNKKQEKLIDSLEKQITKLESGREILMFQIKTLEETRNDLKAQLLEIKQENRELKKLEQK